MCVACAYASVCVYVGVRMHGTGSVSVCICTSGCTCIHVGVCEDVHVCMWVSVCLVCAESLCMCMYAWLNI